MSGARLSLFLGKGGVGRTTIASAFAVDSATRGECVLLVSVVDDDNPTTRIQHEAAGVDTRGKLELLAIDSRFLVDQLVRKITRLGSLADYVLKHPSYDSLIGIAPGVRELAIFHLLAQKRLEGYDRIVLDAPATGHGIHFLEAPQKAAKILAGPLRARAEELNQLLKDADKTDVVIVTLPEEMPVRETIELAATLRAQGFPLDNIVVNKWPPRVFVEPGSRALLAKLSDDTAARNEFERAAAGRAPIVVDDWLHALRLVAAQRQEAENHLWELQALNAKLAVVPQIAESSQRLLRIAEAMRAPVEARP